MEKQAPLDYKRHFSEMVRSFLPIFVIVSIFAIVLWAMFGPRIGIHNQRAPEFDERVGLLYAGEEAGFDPAFSIANPIEMALTPKALRFDAPMGSEHAALTYNAQPFLTSRHLGDDINGIGGGDSDLGDPVYAVADGRVIYSAWPSDSWGNVIIVLHLLPNGQFVETLYAHLKSIHVPVGATVRRGQQIGTVGKADGRYLAHLHFEIRNYTSISPGQGYADAALGRLAGELMLRKWRGAPDDQLNAALEGEPLPSQGVKIEIGDKVGNKK